MYLSNASYTADKFSAPAKLTTGIGFFYKIHNSSAYYTSWLVYSLQ